MNYRTYKLLAMLTFVWCFASTTNLVAADAKNGIARIGIVNFKETVEKSKAGKQEQELYEGMKKQIETILQEKDEEFQKLAKKLKDDDFRDSQKPEALEKMEQQYRSLGQELAQAQGQYYQTLQQANFKIIQKLAELVAKSAEKVAKDKNLDLILNDDQAFYNSSSLDVTDAIVVEMDKIAAEELKESAKNPDATPAAPAKK